MSLRQALATSAAVADLQQAPAKGAYFLVNWCPAGYFLCRLIAPFAHGEKVELEFLDEKGIWDEGELDAKQFQKRFTKLHADQDRTESMLQERLPKGRIFPALAKYRSHCTAQHLQKPDAKSPSCERKRKPKAESPAIKSKKVKAESMSQSPAVNAFAQMRQSPILKTEPKSESKTTPKPEIKLETGKSSITIKIEAQYSDMVKAETNQALVVRDRLPSKKERLRDKYLYQPDGAPRKVFARGCVKDNKDITGVLGGSGTECNPIVKYDRLPFIAAGDLYFAGTDDWNPWHPKYPGAEGVMRFGGSAAKGEGIIRQPGNEFHVFTQCSNLPYQENYYGPEAVGKRLYCGVYELDSDVCSEYIFSQLPTRTQETQLDYCFHRYGERPSGAMRLTDEEREACETVEDQKKALLMKEYMVDSSVHTAFSVVFKRYDEAVYSALVDKGAARGTISPEDLPRLWD
jgi:hypothetical protein